jgi:hypothetical protein
MDANTMPGDAEAAAAIAAMGEIYVSGWRPQPGDMVRVPRPFYDATYIGRVAESVGERWLVDTPDGRLEYLLDEIERVR